MADPRSEAEVDRLIGCLRSGLEQFGDFQANIGAAAVCSFTLCFLKAIVEQGAPESREFNAGKFVGVLRRMAADMELEYANPKQVH